MKKFTVVDHKHVYTLRVICNTKRVLKVVNLFLRFSSGFLDRNRREPRHERWNRVVHSQRETPLANASVNASEFIAKGKTYLKIYTVDTVYLIQVSYTHEYTTANTQPCEISPILLARLCYGFWPDAHFPSSLSLSPPPPPASRSNFIRYLMYRKGDRRCNATRHISRPKL